MVSGELKILNAAQPVATNINRKARISKARTAAKIDAETIKGNWCLYKIMTVERKSDKLYQTMLTKPINDDKMTYYI